MKKIRAFICAISFCFAYTFQAVLIPVNAQARERVVQCSKSYNQLSKTASQNAQIIKRTGEIAVPGSGACTISYSTRTVYKGWGYDLS